MSHHDQHESAESKDMSVGMTILMILFAFAAALIIIYFNHYLAAIPGFNAPPFVVAFCIGVFAVIGFGVLNTIARLGKGESTGHSHH
ncbi:MAG: hypothetical protein U1D96_08605 [Eubacteriales bacterium]|nr:hypothetical protein [Bacillota bacterium]MBV1728098.1 hypothetical protein [Desulforudis sp.]MDQ7788628.1 hypothetical protein [Clostridia bacterium]MDZ4043536.1 hypothetical protein [Eubacteriales bacterium]MBU4554551.1 hypothetical protein [Bacillota bacterium]